MMDISNAARALLESLRHTNAEPPDGWISAKMAAKFWGIHEAAASRKLTASGLQRALFRPKGASRDVYFYGPEQVQTKNQAHKAPSSKPINPTQHMKCKAREK